MGKFTEEKYCLRIVMNGKAKYYAFTYDVVAAFDKNTGEIKHQAHDIDSLIAFIAEIDNIEENERTIKEHYDILTMSELTNIKNKEFLMKSIKEDVNQVFYELIKGMIDLD